MRLSRCLTSLGVGLWLATTPALTRAEPPPDVARAPSPSGLDAAIQRLAADVQRWGGTVSVHVLDVGTGAVVAALDEHRPMNPASNAKLATAAAALRVLGPQHRFMTGLYGRIDGDTVDELVLRSDGDPSLRTADLWTMASELHAAGVRHVRAIVVDQSFFDGEHTPPAFDQQPNEWAAFRAPVAAVSLDENTVTFSVLPTSEGHDAHVEVDPPGFVDLKGSVTTGREKDPERVTVGLEPHGSRLVARLTGTAPLGARAVKLVRRVEDPSLLAGYALKAVLKHAGIEARGGVSVGGASASQLLVSHRSASLGEMLSALGKDSDNFYAEMIFRAVGAHGKARPSTSSAAAEAVQKVLDDAGVAEPGAVVKNGSGLFDANRMTASGTTRLLRVLFRDPSVGPEYVSQLSIGGVDGTIRNRFREWEASRAIRAKTGTLDAVAALSGYVLAPNGRAPVAFSIFVNGISGKVSAARPAMDRIVEAVAAGVWSSDRAQ